MSDSTFVLKLAIPAAGRDGVYESLWARFGGEGGLVGVHEGTVLSEDASRVGFETESWTVDAGEAPRERDWLARQDISSSELYFASRARAEAAGLEITAGAGPQGTWRGLTVIGIQEQVSQDWDAEWKASFLSSVQGVRIPPFWRILPFWIRPEDEAGESGFNPGERAVRINPGAGFGTGTHETTQLCLRAIAEAHQRVSLQGQSVLDFGSGSGILSIGAALLGAEVEGVEIDELANDNAVENACHNGVEERVTFATELPEPREYPLVIANILKPVLLQFAPELTARLAPGGTLILSGLIQKDVADISRTYSALIGSEPQARELNEWRSLVWIR